MGNKLAARAALYYEARKRAKEKGLECTITKDDIHVPDVCPILGIPLVRHKTKFGWDSPSLDRIDNTKGYIPGNVSVISWHANYLKRDLSIAQVENLLRYLKGEA